MKIFFFVKLRRLWRREKLSGPKISGAECIIYKQELHYNTWLTSSEWRENSEIYSQSRPDFKRFPANIETQKLLMRVFCCSLFIYTSWGPKIQLDMKIVIYRHSWKFWREWAALKMRYNFFVVRKMDQLH